MNSEGLIQRASEKLGLTFNDGLPAAVTYWLVAVKWRALL